MKKNTKIIFVYKQKFIKKKIKRFLNLNFHLKIFKLKCEL